MKRPRDTVTTPRDGWSYTEPCTGKKFWHTSIKVLTGMVWNHRMSLPDLQMDVDGGWQDRLLHDICLQNEHLVCDDTEDKGRWVGMGNVWRFIETMTSWVMRGGGFVTQEEAERRATICSSGMDGKPCKHNEHINGCMGCKGIGSALGKILNGRTTSKDQELNVCTACGGCALKAKVWFPREVISVDESKLPSWCWEKTQNHASNEPE